MRFSILMTAVGLSLLQTVPSLAVSGVRNQSTLDVAPTSRAIEIEDRLAQRVVKPTKRHQSARKKEDAKESRSRKSSQNSKRRATSTKRRATSTSRKASPNVRTQKKVRTQKTVVKKSPTRIRKRVESHPHRDTVKVKTIKPAVQPRKRHKTDKIHSPVRKVRTDRIKVIKKPAVKPVVVKKKVVKPDAKRVIKKRAVKPVVVKKKVVKPDTKKVIRKRAVKPVVVKKKVVKPEIKHKPHVKKVKPVIRRAKIKQVKPVVRRKSVDKRPDYTVIHSHRRLDHPRHRTRRSRRGFASPHRFRRVVRRRRAVPYWGTRRVRSRRLTRAYRPCYYCPGRGWSFTSNCNTRARRYYVYSDRYASLLPTFTSSLFSRRHSRNDRFRNDQFLAERVEVAVLNYAELYDLEDLDETLTITQDGSDIIFSGDVENEVILEDLVAIARDTEGVDDVITEDVYVLSPSESRDDFFEDLDLVIDDQGGEEPELVFTAAFDEDFDDQFED